MSKSILLGYYGFQEEPFGATRDSRCLYPSSTHREALASLRYGFASNRGFTALIAQPGMGKTTLLFRFLEDIRESARSVFCLILIHSVNQRKLSATSCAISASFPAGTAQKCTSN
jgi:general secretion pathway protein A